MKFNEIYNEDCLTTLGRLDDESIDVVFADPPFNIGKKYNGYLDKRDDYFEWQHKWIEECFRVLKKTGTFYLMTLDKNLPKTLHSMSQFGELLNLVKWYNVSANHNKKGFWRSTQPIAVYVKSDDYVFNTYAETRVGFKSWDPKRHGRMKGQLLDLWDDIPYVYAGSIIHKEAILKPGTRAKACLAQMPEKLPGRAIMFSSNEGDIIYDPFMGSGTTAIAAIKLGRQFLGSEISPEDYEVSKKRILKETDYILF